MTALHVVTNARFAPGFRDWAAAHRGRLRPVVHDDGTSTNETRLGAIGDIRFTIERGGLAGEDLLVVAGDNLFDFSLADYAAFWRAKGDGSCIARLRVPRPAPRLAVQRGRGGRQRPGAAPSWRSRPSPRATWWGSPPTSTGAAHAALIPTYLAEGNSPDAPGNLVAWLHQRVPVYAYRFGGEWIDIGDKQQLLEADNTLRVRQGLPPREAYSPD